MYKCTAYISQPSGDTALFMSRDVRFSKMWYVRPAKSLISLRKRTV